MYHQTFLPSFLNSSEREGFHLAVPLTVMDQVRDTKNTEDGWMDHITLRNAFRNLQPREKQILSLRFYDGKTQMEVAGALGISQAQVSRLEKGAITAMRKSVSVS